MKKSIFPLTVILAMFLFSCSDSNETDQLPLTYNNIAGVWYIKDIINADGAIVSHVNLCPSKRDSIIVTIASNHDIFGYINNNCATDNVSLLGCGSFILDQNTRKLTNCNSPFNGTISEFTDKKLQINYDVILDLTYMSDTNMAKGIILTRQ